MLPEAVCASRRNAADVATVGARRLDGLAGIKLPFAIRRMLGHYKWPSTPIITISWSRL